MDFSGRFFFVTTLLVFMVISYAYSGNLVSFMTVPKLAMPIDKLEEVLDSGLPWEMVVYGVEVEDAMASGALGLVVKELWEGKIPREYSPTPQVLTACYGVLVCEWGLIIIFLRCKMYTRENLSSLTTNLV